MYPFLALPPNADFTFSFKMMMMMIMLAGFVDSLTTPIKSWLDKVSHSLNLNNTDDLRHMTVIKEVGFDTPRVECIVCLSDVAVGDRFATLRRCGHGFHVDCVEAWLKDHPNCPLCRTPVSYDTPKHRVYLKKSYEVVTGYGLRVLDIVATWLTSSFSRGLQSSLSESCSLL